MRVVMLSWEYPPKLVGGIARHVYDLSHALVEQGIEVHVVTADHPNAPAEEEEIPGLFIHRVSAEGRADDFVNWVHLLNEAIFARTDALLDKWTKGKPWDKKSFKDGIILHAHDWLAEFAATPLKHKYKLPLIATIHATEHGRNNGIGTDIQRYINSIEWKLAHEAWRIIACSEYMRGEISNTLSANLDKIDVIYNGVEAAKFNFEFSEEERQAYRAKFAAPDEKLVFYVGRFVREKGIHILLDAVPRVMAAYPKVKFIIVGGGWREHFVNYTRFLGVNRSVFFAGFVPDDELLKLYRVIDVATFPSLYEPFGIVALEAMAAHVPTVVSDAGGLKEIVQHEVSGTVTWLNNSDSLAWGILNVLKNPKQAKEMADKAYDRAIKVFNWDLISKQTIDTYKRVWEEFGKSGW